MLFGCALAVVIQNSTHALSGFRQPVPAAKADEASLYWELLPFSPFQNTRQ